MLDIREDRLGNMFGEDKGTGFAGNVWNKNMVSPTLTTMQGGYRQPMIIEDFYQSRPIRVYENFAPSLRSERNGLKVVE